MFKKIILSFLFFCVLGSTASFARDNFSAMDISDYKKGWMASIYAFSKGEDVSVDPPSPVGMFLANKSSYVIDDYIKPLGFPISNKTIGWKGEGYINVETPGYHVFILGIGNACGGSISIDGKEIARGGSEATIVATVELGVGMHQVVFKVANYTDGMTAQGRTYYSKQNGFNFRVKRPSDNVPVQASDVLYTKK